MQLLTIILAAATASALDIGLMAHKHCHTGGGGYYCQATLTSTCCFLPSGTVNSIWFEPVDPEWNINVYGFEHGQCNGLKSTAGHFGDKDACLSNGPYTGGRWDWRASKRRSTGDCVKQLPGHYKDAEGKKYSLAGMSEAEISEFDAHVGNGTVGHFYNELLM